MGAGTADTSPHSASCLHVLGGLPRLTQLLPPSSAGQALPGLSPGGGKWTFWTVSRGVCDLWGRVLPKAASWVSRLNPGMQFEQARGLKTTALAVSLLAATVSESLPALRVPLLTDGEWCLLWAPRALRRVGGAGTEGVFTLLW